MGTVGMENTTISLYGGTYTGDVYNDLPNGLGVWVHPDGQACAGKWVYGTFHGRAALKLSEGETYVGACKYGQFFSETDGPAEKEPFHKSCVFHGQGTLTKANGTRFVGEWRLGKLWNGVRWDKDGVVTEKYSVGQMLSEQQLSPALKKTSSHLGVFLIAPAILGWLVIVFILLLILAGVVNSF